MKKRITALTLVFLMCLTFGSSALAMQTRAALTTQAGVENGYQFAKIRSTVPEKLSVSFVLYKVEGSRLIRAASGSASNSGTTNTVTAQSYESLSSGTYKMNISGGSASHPVSEARYFTI